MFNILYIVKTSDRQLSIHGNGYYLFVYKAGGGSAGITGTISSHAAGTPAGSTLNILPTNSNAACPDYKKTRTP